jgi:hypothetical protein
MGPEISTVENFKFCFYASVTNMSDIFLNLPAWSDKGRDKERERLKDRRKERERGRGEEKI